MEAIMEGESLPFGLWLKRKRRALDLTQEELAQQIGCALVTLRKIESGERRPSKPILERLAAILSIPPAEQPAFMTYARAIYPGAAPSLRAAVRETPDRTPWQMSARPVRTDNLPLQLTSFIGREYEVAEVQRLLAETRLLTLTGSGGSGKTRLALHAAAGLLSEYADGVWWVELASLFDPALVPQEIGAALGLRDEAKRPLLDQLGDHLHGKSLLLVLDNCEHLIAACATCADVLLHAAPDLRILVTSIEPLAIAGETTYRVPSLRVPDPEHLPPPAGLAQFEAVRLFVERGAAVQPGFAVTEANGAAIADICQRLDGIPLAIELAAARIKMLSVEELRIRLGDQLRVLTGGSRVALPRHRTLRATLDWSYGLLAEPERILLRRLAVFVGGWTLEAAEAICGGDSLPEAEVLDYLASLVDKSLVILEWPNEAGRYRTLETVRQYASEKLVSSGETQRLRDEHVRYFLSLAEAAVPHLRGSGHLKWLRRLEGEHDNLRTALGWSVESEPHLALRLAGALWGFWFHLGHSVEGYEWALRTLQAAPDAPARDRMRGLYTAADFAGLRLGRLSEAIALAEESLALGRETGDALAVAISLHQLGIVAIYRGNYDEAERLCQEGLAVARAAHESWPAGFLLQDIGLIRVALGADEAAERFFMAALETHRERGDDWPNTYILRDLGSLAERRGDAERAESLYRQSLSLALEYGDRPVISYDLVCLGRLALRGGELATASQQLTESLRMEWGMASTSDMPEPLDLLAELVLAQDDPLRAARLAAAADAVREELKLVLSPAETGDHDRLLAAVRDRLAPAAFEAAWAEGRALGLDRAVAYALSG
jgi:non-specific serine/threonine protein kinase